jgi:DNA (cytosine-5)-methyltransferase 1
VHQFRLPLRDTLTSLELCAGAGGQALGLEQAGFHHEALAEIDPDACNTLRHNRPQWRVIEGDLAAFDPAPFRGIDLLAGGLPCPPFSIAGKQLGERDERNLFPLALDIIDATRPRAVMIENVKGFLGPSFADFRERLREQLVRMGYRVDWRLLNACDFGVPQLRPRVVIVALRPAFTDRFVWPQGDARNTPTVGQALRQMMASQGWEGADAWARQANAIAPTLVGGSKKHGGPDLGPTRARAAWAALGVNGGSLAEEPPLPGATGLPRLTVPMVARLQGFPPDWVFTGRKTAAYRQVGNAFPPPVAQAVASRISEALGIATALQGAA